MTNAQPEILATYTVTNEGSISENARVLIYGRRGWYQIQWHGVQRRGKVAQSSEFASRAAAEEALSKQADTLGVVLKRV